MTLNTRVLIVDDEPDIHYLIKLILRSSKGQGTDTSGLEAAAAIGAKAPKNSGGAPVEYQVDSAYQGEEGLGMVEQALMSHKPYALILMDMRMPPGWDGLKTIQEVWKIAPDTEIVIVSAYSQHSRADLVATLGDISRLGIIKKPFLPKEIREVVAAAVTRWNVVQQMAAGADRSEAGHES